MRKSVIASLSTVVGLGLLGLFIWLTGPSFIKTVFVLWRTFDFFLLVLILGIAAVAVVARISYKKYDNGGNWAGYTVIAVAIGLGTLAYFVYLCIASSYDSAQHYASSVTVTHKTVPSFNSRAPYKVAVESSNRNLQNVTGTADVTKSVADEGKTGSWNTLIIRRGVGVGYEAVQTIETPLYGSVTSSDVKFCKFDSAKAPLRFGGALVQNNLGRVLDWTVPMGVTYDSGDAYGYCDGSTPYVVIPLKEVHGFYGAWETPYGDATYNGKTGEIKILTSKAAIAKLPGSTYPMSLVVSQRDATAAVGSLGDYNWGSTGFQTTANDGNDPNAENDSEFQLQFANSDGVGYVTPVTPRGDSTSIVGIAVSNAKAYTPGKLNSYTIYEYGAGKSRDANSTVENDIKAKYASSSAWASGIKIFEIVPAENGTWVASIGQNQNVIWRAVVTSDGKITLYKNGEKVDNLSTDTSPAPTAPTTGTGTGTVDNSNVVDGVDLSKLTPEQLQQLGQQILAELAKRAN